MALFFCRRWAKEAVKIHAPKFTIEEIEPFAAVDCGDAALRTGVVAIVIGVAIKKTDGRWGVHELSDETDVHHALSMGTSLEVAEKLKNKAVLETKRRLVEALNRLGEHYERVYVYATRP